MKYTNKEMQFMLAAMNNSLHELNDWELGFLEKIGPRILSEQELTHKQAEKFSQIWDKLEDLI